MGEHVPLCPTDSSEERHNRRRTSERFSKAQGPGRDSGCLDLRVVVIILMEYTEKQKVKTHMQSNKTTFCSCHLGSPAFNGPSSMPSNFTVFLWHAYPHPLVTTASCLLHHSQIPQNHFLHFLLFYSLFHPYAIRLLPHHPTKIY